MSRYRPTTCRLCGKEMTMGGIAKHMVVHFPQEAKHACPHCPRTFTHAGAFARHLEGMHGEFDDRRFFRNVHMTSGCWVWMGCLDSKGYGQIMIHRKRLMAHRVGYEGMVGPIPDGLVLDHLCRNTSCVRPDHLEVVTFTENVRRGHRDTQTTCPYCDLRTNPGNIARHVASKHRGVAA